MGDRNNSPLMAALALGMLTLFAMSLLALLYREIPNSNRESISLLIGAIIAHSGNVISHYFGSSKRETTLDNTVGTLADAAKSESAARAAMVPPTDAVVIAPGESATVTAATTDGPKS